MNFIFFMPDELRATSLGCYGHPLDVSPHIDAFARQGTRFDQCHVQHTVCSPSRCSMLTGWHPHVRGHRTLWHLLRPDEPNLFRYLKRAGYDVHWFGKNDALSPDSFADSVTQARSYGQGYPFGDNPWSRQDPQFYSFLHEPYQKPLAEHSDYANVMAAIDVLKSESAQPFAIYLPLLYPHCPYSAPDPWHSRFAPEAVAEHLIPPCPEGKPSFHAGMRALRRLDRCAADLFAQVNAVYLGMTAFIDYLFGLLLDALESSPHRDDTTVMFFSDHGDYAGDYGLVEKWPNAAEDAITRVPWIVRTPDGPAGGVEPSLVELFDLMPTTLKLAGLAAEHSHFAQDQTAVLHGAVGNPERLAFTEGGYDLHEPHCFEGRAEGWGTAHPYWPKLELQRSCPASVARSVAVRSPQYKWVHRPGDVSEFYDLAQDPAETRNLIHDDRYAEAQDALRHALLDWLLTTSDVTPWDENPRGHTWANVAPYA